MTGSALARPPWNRYTAILLAGLALAAATILGIANLGSDLAEDVPDGSRRGTVLAPAAPILGGNEAGARSDLPAVPDLADGSEDVTEAIRRCLGLSGSDRQECLTATMPALPAPEFIGDILCDLAVDHEAAQALLLAALIQVEPAQALKWLDRLVARCQRGEGAGLHAGVLWNLGRDHPAWFASFKLGLYPTRIYSPGRSRAIVQLVQLVAREDPVFRTWLEEGATGAWGGDDAQIRQSVASATVLQDGPSAKLDFLEEVYEANVVAGRRQVAAMVASQSLFQQHWPDGNPQRSLLLLQRMLADPRCQAEVARYLLAEWNASPPLGMDPSAWAPILDRARALAGH